MPTSFGIADWGPFCGALWHPARASASRTASALMHTSLANGAGDGRRPLLAVSSPVRRAGLVAGCGDARIVRDAKALGGDLVRVGPGVLEHVHAHVLVRVHDVTVHGDRVAPGEDVGRKQLLGADRHTFGIDLRIRARTGGAFGAPLHFGGRPVEEEAELERALRARDVDGTEAASVPRREEDAPQCWRARYGWTRIFTTPCSFATSMPSVASGLKSVMIERQ